MLDLGYARMKIEPTYRILFMQWLMEDGTEMPLVLDHLGKALISVGVDLDLLHLNILENG